MEFSKLSTVGFNKFKIPSVNESRVGLSPKSSVPSAEVQVEVPSSIIVQTTNKQSKKTKLAGIPSGGNINHSKRREKNAP